MSDAPIVFRQVRTRSLNRTCLSLLCSSVKFCVCCITSLHYYSPGGGTKMQDEVPYTVAIEDGFKSYNSVVWLTAKKSEIKFSSEMTASDVVRAGEARVRLRRLSSADTAAAAGRRRHGRQRASVIEHLVSISSQRRASKCNQYASQRDSLQPHGRRRFAAIFFHPSSTSDKCASGDISHKLPATIRWTQ